MKIEILSDTHGTHESVEMAGGDLAIFAGDFTARDTHLELEQFARWYGSQSHEHKLIVCGNHDSDQISYEGYSTIFARHGITYMQDETVVINGLSIYAMPWTPTFYNWSWMKDRGQNMREMTGKIPVDTNILVTHGPQFGVMDLTEEGDYVGCEELSDRLTFIKKPLLHCFGHIHEGYGIREAEPFCGDDGYISVNASIVNRQYKPVNKPVVVEL